MIGKEKKKGRGEHISAIENKGYDFKATISLHSMWVFTAMQIKIKMQLCQSTCLVLYVVTYVFIQFFNLTYTTLFPPWVCLEWSRSKKKKTNGHGKFTQHSYLLKQF